MKKQIFVSLLVSLCFYSLPGWAQPAPKKYQSRTADIEESVRRAIVETNPYRESEFVYYAAAGMYDWVKAYLDQGMDVNALSMEQYTALMGAASEPYSSENILAYECIIKMLLKRGADPNKQNLNGETAAMLAVQQNRLITVKQLIAAHARLDLQDKNGYTALFMAAKRGHSLIVKALLESAPLTVFTPDNKGDLPIHAAVTAGHFTTVQELLKVYRQYEESPLYKNHAGKNVIQLAEENGHAAILALLKQEAKKDYVRHPLATR